MSRARKISNKWFDMKRNAAKATDEQVALLASVENVSVDDLLDYSLSQGEVVERLRDALGEGKIPPEIEERRKRDRKRRQEAPKCRICGKEGDSTKHHFVNRWILKELHNYQELCVRSLCTVPVCLACHRDLHSRNDSDKRIYPYLDSDEKKFADVVIEQLRKEHPKVFNLLANGEEEVYEACLIKDWLDGYFDTLGK